MMGTTMGEGERAEAMRRRRSAILIGTSAAVAVAMVAGTAIFKQAHGQLVPGWAAVFVGLYLLMMVVIWRFTCRISDEVEIRINVDALAVGGATYALVYPSWYFLWRGSLVPEPSHELLFVIAFAATIIAYCWKRFR